MLILSGTRPKAHTSGVGLSPPRGGSACPHGRRAYTIGEGAPPSPDTDPQALPAQCTTERPHELDDSLTTSPTNTCAMPKQEARRRALDARDSLPEDERERLADAVRARALELPELAAAGTVMLFASFRTELDTMPIARWVLEAGKRLCLPRVLGPRLMAAYQVARPGRRPRPRQVGHPRAARRAAGGARRRRWTWCSCPGPRSTKRAAAAATAAASTTTTCRSRGRARRGSRSRSRRNWCRASTCEAHDLPVTAIVTERRVIRPD